MAELADAADLKSADRKALWVQVPLAPQAEMTVAGMLKHHRLFHPTFYFQDTFVS
jgi:hypothetical protein